MSNEVRLHIISWGESWKVKREGSKRAYKICRNMTDAITEAILFAVRNVSQDNPVSIYIHNEDASVRSVLEVKKVR